MDRIDLEQWKGKEVARLLALVDGERRYYRDMVSALPVGLAVLGPDRVLVSTNRAFRKMFGLRTEELAGKTIEQVISSDRVVTDRIVEKIRDAHLRAEGQAGTLFELGEKLLRVSAVPMSTEDPDREAETLLVAEDVTEARQRPASAPVETVKPPQETNVTAERNAAIQRLSAQMAHDLNNPLMVITGFAEEILESLGQDDPRRGDVEQILTATQRMAGLTAKLSEFTRRQGKAAAPVELTGAISGMQKKLEAAAGAGVTLKLRLGEPLWALANREQLEEILLALVSPGREDAHGRSRLTITCGMAAAVEGRRRAQITVEENGRGMDAEKCAAVFESFLGKEPTAAELAQAYGIVRDWGGEMACSSVPSRGTTFAIYLPLAESGAKAGRPVAAKASQAPLEGARETVLVVDDEAGIRDLLVKILRRERYQVLQASSVREALAVASVHDRPIHLLLTDVMLGDQSGRQLAEQMREALPTIKVLYISGFTSDEKVSTGEFPPGAKFLAKPFTIGALIGKVREALG